MTNPTRSFQTDFGRFYAHPSFILDAFKAKTALGSLGREAEIDPTDPYAPKPSVTNIIGMLNKAFLPPYYAKLVAEYAIENLDNLQETVKKFGPKVAVGTLKAIPNRPNPAAAIGDEVHNAIDMFVRNEEPDEGQTFSTPTAQNMYLQFLNFVSQAKPEIIRSEYTVWSYKHGYAGTGDLMWKLWGGLWIVDTKTGNQAHPEVAMQTSALAHADVILDANGNDTPMPQADIQGVLHVRPRSVKLHKLAKTDEAFEAFLACKRLFDWNRFEREAVLLDPYKTEMTKAA